MRSSGLFEFGGDVRSGTQSSTGSKRIAARRATTSTRAHLTPARSPTSAWAWPSTAQMCRWDSARGNAVAPRATAAGPASVTAVAPRADWRATVPVSRVSDQEVRTELRIGVGPRAPTASNEVNGPSYRCPPTQHRARY